MSAWISERIARYLPSFQSSLVDVVSLMAATVDKMDQASGISIQISGSHEDQQDSFSDLGTLAVLIIILVLANAAQFESLSYPFIIMFSIPSPA
ncbi:MAG: efflux RND transporter permease subunit [Bacteroides thetaiotaomicron]